MTKFVDVLPRGDSLLLVIVKQTKMLRTSDDYVNAHANDYD